MIPDGFQSASEARTSGPFVHSQIPATIFVDLIFTNFSDPRFTKTFEGRAQMSCAACVLRACIAD
jgi:hypothetical protein